jgi:CTD small phosphatase-like protein 2
MSNYYAKLLNLIQTLDKPELHVIPTTTNLPPSWHVNTLVLDLDNTLICCRNIKTENEFADDNDKIITINGDQFLLKIRPYLTDFLNLLRPFCEIIVFTAAHRTYANEVKKIIDPDNTFIDHLLTRENCTKINDAYVKDLSTLNRNLANTIIVDDQLHSFIMQTSNGILIPPWEGEADDRELVLLGKFLVDLFHKGSCAPLNP